MFNTEWASCLTRALWQLRYFVSADVVAIALPLVARIAKVRVSPAEPLRNTAAEFALELDEIGAMFWARAFSESERLRRALSADEILRLEVLSLILCCDAVLHAAEVGLAAFEALVIG